MNTNSTPAIAPETPCLDCGAPLALACETRRYDFGGLPDVVLDGVPTWHCAVCGYGDVELPDLPGLHRTLAVAFASEPARLAPAELRFLRKLLGWSSRDAALPLLNDNYICPPTTTTSTHFFASSGR